MYLDSNEKQYYSCFPTSLLIMPTLCNVLYFKGWDLYIRMREGGQSGGSWISTSFDILRTGESFDVSNLIARLSSGSVKMSRSDWKKKIWEKAWIHFNNYCIYVNWQWYSVSD